MSAVVAVDHMRKRFARDVAFGIRGAEDGPAELWPEEECLLSDRAVQRRRLHFALGRGAARNALKRLGAPEVPIGRGRMGEPLWPSGVTGSIAHAGSAGVAVVGWERDFLGLGIDLEEVGRDTLKAAGTLICLPPELAWAQQPTLEGDRTLRLVMTFSAKEAVYKALAPHAQVSLGFTDVCLTWSVDLASFAAVLLRTAGPWPEGLSIPGECVADTETVLTVAACRSLGPTSREARPA